MTDAVGRLGTALADRYVIERELGTGGMATVYLAHDVRHDRDVALKVLRPDLAVLLGRDRFLTEIRLTAKLDHPHILTLIDSGDSDGFLWYVLPYVRGESLRDRLNRDTQLGVEEALVITRQIAGVLDYAHQRGVIHRDIKPENILLHEGEAMLADFGIALAVKEAGGHRLTETGLSLGTPQYMSPEQATGDRQLDARSDLYSLGAVLYEMLAGEPPVTGPTVQAVIAKLLTERPTRLRVIRDTVPEGVDAAVARALAKVPADRFGSAGELVEALAASGNVPGRATHRWRRALAIGGSTLLLAAVALVVWWVGRRHAAGTFVARDKTQLTFTGNAGSPAISADGKQVAYVAKGCTAGSCRSRVEVLDLGTGTTRVLVDDVTGAENLRWSQDRRFLLFSGSIGSRLGTYLVSTLGDHPRSISITTTSATFVPGQDSLLLSLPHARDSMGWVAVATLAGEYRDSVPIHLERPGELGEAFVWPGGRWIVVEAAVGAEGSSAYRHAYLVVDRRGRQRDAIHVPGEDDTWAFVRPDALWMQLVSSGNLVRIPFDGKAGRFTGAWDTVLAAGSLGFDVSEDGQSLVYADGSAEYGLWALDLADALKGKFPPGRRLRSGTIGDVVRLSPDGTSILDCRTVATGGGQGSDIVLLPFQGGAEIMHRPVDSLLSVEWSPDGQAFIYAEKVAGRVRLVTVDVRTGRQQSPVEMPDSDVRGVRLMSDGAWAWPGGRGAHLWRSGERSPRVLPMLRDELALAGLIPAPNERRLALLGSISQDSAYLDVAQLPERPPTRWAAFAGTTARGWWLADGSIVVWIQESEDQGTLYRVTGPGRVEPLGIIPRAVRSVSLSQDGRRVALVTFDSRVDVWLAHLAPAARPR